MHRPDGDAPEPTVAGPASSAPRRPVRARDTRAARRLAASLARRGAPPDAISAVGALANGLAGTALVLAGTREGVGAALGYAAAAALIGVRALCSLLDGMVAAEGGRATRTGAVWNELPDRLSEPLLLACAGTSIPGAPWGPALGWAAAALAATVAYVRVLGGALGAPWSFAGPMAKQHRMAALAAGSLAAGAEALGGAPPRALAWSLAAVTLGCAVTILRRTRAIVRSLHREVPSR